MNNYVVNDVLFKVDFVIRRVYCEKYKNKNLQVHLLKNCYQSKNKYNQIIGINGGNSSGSNSGINCSGIDKINNDKKINCDGDDDDFLYRYPCVTCNVKLPKIRAGASVKFVEFDLNKKLKFKIVNLDTKLYFVHHRDGNQYVYGQVPAVSSSRSDKNRVCAFVGSPVFDSENKLISFVTDYYLEDKNLQIVPVASESYRLQGTFAVNGRVKIYNLSEKSNLPEKSTVFEKRGGGGGDRAGYDSGENSIMAKNQSSIDCCSASCHVNINVYYTNKLVEVFVLRDNETVSHIKMRCKFAGDMLIL
ncbi:P26-2 [Trabala vishnou gigantina nucleopolyhedrovirus]|uniref:P26-2 n=1 Tax=Trabala vishnou gigantina nucleopolyhedrovirus TaxID=2863583 RepID=UPI002481E2A0|nr:P26-2 [Trabala vishnou gigantina nucleopolyhedrovirus]QYC92709.1 P26-2 [Trabala vishnou gigantina nucleopolyhedrovirus]